MIDRELLALAIKEGKVSLGCPLPEGFKGHTDEDMDKIRQAMLRIIELEKAMGSS